MVNRSFSDLSLFNCFDISMKLVGNSTYNNKDFCHHFSKPVHLSAQGFCMNQEGGCHVPGLNVSPFPLGSLNLPTTSLEESCCFHANQGALRFFSKIFCPGVNTAVPWPCNELNQGLYKWIKGLPDLACRLQGSYLLHQIITRLS
jgi:hypothetical protein